jgi:uncharacterized NAD-dependent epimerase/dehydratase family protein
MDELQLVRKIEGQGNVMHPQFCKVEVQRVAIHATVGGPHE